MIKTRRLRGLTIAITALAVAGSAVGYAAITDASGDGPTAIEKIEAAAPGPGRPSRAFGVSSANAVPVLKLPSGESLGLLISEAGKCVVRSSPQHLMGEICVTTAELGTGNGITVADECGSAGENRMKIYGLAAEQAAAARLRYSDTTTAAIEVAGGVFAFEGTNPKAGARYPTGVQWLDAKGNAIGSAELPVAGDDFCPGG